MSGQHTGDPTESPGSPGGAASPRRGKRDWGWRLATPVVVALTVVLVVVSYNNSDGTDLRPGRYQNLAELTQAESDEYNEVTAEVADLNQQIADLTESVDDQRVRQLRREMDGLKDAAGLEEVSGPGITVTLSDAPEDIIDEVRKDPAVNVNDYVVHQQDIQAVVNAMWEGGAKAVTVAGQRIVSTTGIRCEGNAVQLQGVPYPQPYEISAVGDPEALEDAIGLDERLTTYQAAAADPDFQLGWDLDVEDDIDAPAYEGLLDLNLATPVD